MHLYDNRHTTASAISQRGSKAHAQDKLSMDHDEDIFNKIMALIDKRNRLCEQWIEKITFQLARNR